MIEREVAAGRVKAKKAIITIGGDHLDKIIQFIIKEQAEISGIWEGFLPEGCTAEKVRIKLGLKQMGYGCAVYRPRSMD